MLYVLNRQRIRFVAYSCVHVALMRTVPFGVALVIKSATVIKSTKGVLIR
jgi:hypothetical protein